MRKNKEQMNGILVLVPAYNPDEKLLHYVEALKEQEISNILVVDDGSRSDCQWIFEKLKQDMGINVIHHQVNCGKGRALKTGFQWCMEHMPQCGGVVTADSDGQHSPVDTRRIAEALLQSPEEMILGIRNFDEEQVPFKSSFGNKVTSVVFKLLYGTYLKDTQTGLRGIPKKYLQEVTELSGERYEYEIRMLILAARKKIPIKEIIIETIYIDDNKETHFRPVHDSLRIYGVMFAAFFKYLLSSLSSSLIDMGLFALLNIFVFAGLDVKVNVVLSTLLARVVSSACNFMINRKIVFGVKSNLTRTLIAYYILVIVQMGASAGLVALFTVLLGWPAVVVKAIVDSCLFLVSFQIQQRVVFRE